MQVMRNVFALNETGGRVVFLSSAMCRRLMKLNATPALEAESKACGDTVEMVSRLATMRSAGISQAGTSQTASHQL